MKKSACLLFVFSLILMSCEKDNSAYTGTLKMTFTIAGSNDFSKISIYIYAMDNLDYSLFEGHPDQNGIYSKELLPGNYRASVFLGLERGNPTFQIVNGKATTFKLDL